MARYSWALLLLPLLCLVPARSQSGGRPGEAVIYAVTANGSGDLQDLSGDVTNTDQALARFRYVDSTTLPNAPSLPFPILRQTLYEDTNETFLVGNDFENSRGIHRLTLVPVKFMLAQGILQLREGIATGSSFITFPQGIDVQGDVSALDTKILFWAPMKWPFLQPTDSPGPAVPPGMTGIQYLLSTPGLVKLLPLLTWTPITDLYPGTSWKPGVDLKMLDLDSKTGDTIRLIRLRVGKSTPFFRTAGHTHLYVLQGSVTLTPAGGSRVTLKPNYYAFVPEGLALRLSNPKTYDGPNVQ